MQVFERSLLRAGYVAVFTEGYNPKPRLEFAQPLPLGVEAQAEIARVDVANFDRPEGFRERLNRALPEGVIVTRVQAAEPLQPGEKKLSLMAAYWGAEYRIEGLESAARETILSALAGHPDPPVAIVNRDGAALVLRTTRKEKGAANVFRVLEELGAADAARADLIVTRLGLLAAAPDGEPQDFFDLYR
jgi:radical SAM-linked protein